MTFYWTNLDNYSGEGLKRTNYIIVNVLIQSLSVKHMNVYCVSFYCYDLVGVEKRQQGAVYFNVIV